MTRHCKVYMKYFDYKMDEFIPCECCGRKANDIHHISGRGKNKDVIENLMALCRKCHERIHQSEMTRSSVQYIHNNFLMNNRVSFMK
jgi:hypothetical protein